MAYRFNPPPNWPIQEPGWTPPPGWQPDPSWGPAPEGWDFWTQDAEDGGQTAGAMGDAAGADRGDDDDATRISRSSERDVLAPSTTDPESGAEQANDPFSSSSSSDAPSAPSFGADDDATRVSSSRERDALAPGAMDSAAMDSAAMDSGATGSESSTSGSGAAATSEYQAADLHADAPYENAAPSAGAGATAAGATAAGAAFGASQGSTDGYGQASPNGYGQASPNGYGQPSPNGYGQASPNGYGQPSPNGYGQASPNGYGQPTTGDAYGGNGTGQQWSSVQGAGGEPPKKSFLARFWWLGCIALVLIAALLAGIIFAVAALSGGDKDDKGGKSASPTTTVSDSPSATTSGTPTDEGTLAANQPTIDPAAPSTEVLSSEGKGTMQVSMAWVSPDQIPADYGSIEAPSNGDQYLAATVHIKIDEGTMSMNPYTFALITPYGGEIAPSTVSYQAKDNGISNADRTDVNAGEEYTMVVYFDVGKNGGLKLRYDNYENKYDWDVPV